MPTPRDVADRFAEHLRQQGASNATVIQYATAARAFGRWIESDQRYRDALVDVAARDAALRTFWADLATRSSKSTLHVTRFALRKLFHWLELPPANFETETPAPVGETVTLPYGAETTVTYAATGEPVKARAMCVDGKVRTAELFTEIYPNYWSAKLSVIKAGRRYKITGHVTIATVTGEPVKYVGNPLVAKFEANEHSKNVDAVGYGLWHRAI